LPPALPPNARGGRRLEQWLHFACPRRRFARVGGGNRARGQCAGRVMWHCIAHAVPRKPARRGAASAALWQRPRQRARFEQRRMTRLPGSGRAAA
jgi:hypothetical protein